MTPLRIAAAQFPVSGNMDRNLKFIQKLIERGAGEGVQVIVFPEAALPGYGPKHYASFDDFDWDKLDQHTQTIQQLADQYKIWIILGTMRRGDGGLPKNCVIVVSKDGDIVGSYDKRRLYKREKEFYSPGENPLTVDIEGHKCGFLICYDNCYPELYEEYRSAGVGLLFHAVFNAANSKATTIEALATANMIVRAADHQMWIAASNSSSRYSPFPATIARPDGSLKRARRHVTSLVIDDYPLCELGWTYDNRTF